MTLDVDRDRIANATTGPEIEITDEMVNRGVRFLEDSFVSNLTTSAAQPGFVRELLKFTINGRSDLRRSDKS
jgi:hypothetical protein